MRPLRRSKFTGAEALRTMGTHPSPSPPVLLSFDAIGTLIKIRGGVGWQYLTALQQFVNVMANRSDAQKRVKEEEAQWLADLLPFVSHNCTTAASAGQPQLAADASLMETVAWDAIRLERDVDRAAWVEKQQQILSERLSPGDTSLAVPSLSINPREMPLGGRTDESVYSFWRRVLQRSFHDARIWSVHSGQEQRRTTQGEVEAMAPTGAWEILYRHVAKDLFGTGEAYAWLPAGRETIAFLVRHHERLSRRMGAASLPQPYHLVAPPWVLSNSDRRIEKVFTDLGAMVGPWRTDSRPLSSSMDDRHDLLLGGVVTAMDVGRAKPSPAGLVRCVEMATQMSADASWQARADQLIHIHVGDTEDDRNACTAAPHKCHYLACDSAVGIQLHDLLAKIEEVK